MWRAVPRLAARLPVRSIVNHDECQALVQHIIDTGHKNVGVDCEGVRIGRFGHLSLLQMSTKEGIFLIDALSGGQDVIRPLQPLFAHKDIVKVFHDCREDASLLFHQYGINMVSVYDTQVGHCVWLERQNLEAYQANAAEVLRTFRLNAYKKHRWDLLESRQVLPQRWGHRPLDIEALRYAIEGVLHLLPLQTAICRALGDPYGDMVLRRSQQYIQYVHINSAEMPTDNLKNLKPGAPLQAMLAARKPDAAYFKVNNDLLTGAVLDATDLRDFVDVQPGDILQCRVKSVSKCGEFVHLQREGHGNLFYDFKQQRVRGMPTEKEAADRFTSKQSSMYEVGRGFGGPAIQQDPPTHRERKSPVIFMKGKRGRTKIRKTTLTPARRQATHTTFPATGEEFR